MWTVVYMSKDADDIARLRTALRENSVISATRKREDFFELLVPSCEVSLAHNAIIDMEI
ncbi:MAG: hypothetical protein IK072_04565 [Clostridia bacterium]|nr:hypothetical protein [Clostridia bacterium]